MTNYIEVKTAGRRQLIRAREVVRLEESEQGTTLVYLDSWLGEPLACEDSYEQVAQELQMVESQTRA